MSNTALPAPVPASARRGGRVTVILHAEPGGRDEQFQLHDDAAQVVRFVCALAAELTAAQFYSLVFDASAGDIKPRLEKRYEALKRKGALH